MRHLALRGSPLAPFLVFVAVACGLSAAAPSAAVSPAAAKPVGGADLAAHILRPVLVRSAASARVAYRIDRLSDAAGDVATVDLVVVTLEGDTVRRLLKGALVPTGVARRWTGRVRLPPGQYRLVLTGRDGYGRAVRRPGLARLRVLPSLPPLVPTAASVRKALAWAARREGRVAVAVVDSRGHLHGLHATAGFTSASVVKSMLLVAFLRSHATIPAGMRATLAAMIRCSDNAATAVVYSRVGRSGLMRLARRAGMRGFRPYGGWITTRITAADLARFFLDMERYIPKRHRQFANRLLAGIVPSQRWGIPAAAAPRGYRTYFKGGWLGAFILANQAARLERGKVRLGLAVFTDGNPSSGYGLETIRGTTARLLSR